MTRPACWLIRKAPRRFTEMVRSHASRERFSAGARTTTPALLTKMSIDWNLDATALMAAATDSASVTSHAMAAVAFPSETARCAASSARSNITTVAPLLTYASVIAAPMPDAPPVTTATLPASEKSRRPAEGVSVTSFSQNVTHLSFPSKLTRHRPAGVAYHLVHGRPGCQPRRDFGSLLGRHRLAVGLLKQVAQGDALPGLGRPDRPFDHSQAHQVSVHLTVRHGTVAQRRDELGQGTGDSLGTAADRGGDRCAIGGLCYWCVVAVPDGRAVGSADPPTAVPRCLEAGAAPAAGEQEPGAVGELGVHLGGRVAGVPAPTGVERLAGDRHRLAADQVASQVELVDRHVLEQGVGHLLSEAAKVRAPEDAAGDKAKLTEPGDQPAQRFGIAPITPGLRDHQQSAADLGGRDHG